jgi:Protein of unknown function (DUF4230)
LPLGKGKLRKAGAAMTPEDRTQPNSKSGSLWKGIFLGVLLALLATGLLVWLTTGVGLLHLLGTFRNGQSLIHVDQPTVVRQIAQLQRLETVKFTMDKIISGERGSPYLPRLLVSDRLLLVAHGEVIAGVDLSGIQAADVSVQGEKVAVIMPKAQILVTRLDNDKTKVYSRDTGLFSTPDPNLESEVRQEAEHQLQQAALDGDILKSADDNARVTIASLLKGLGFNQVDFH